MDYHHYCSKCLGKLSSSSLKKNVQIVDNKGYFIEFPIANRWNHSLRGKNFMKSCSTYLHVKRSKKETLKIYMTKKSIWNISRIMDFGQIRTIFPFCGIQIISIWPIFLVTRLRYKSENMVFAGIWYGTRKPDQLYF